MSDYPVIDTLAMELKNILRAIEPAPEVTEHFRNARIEVLKGIRHMIDNRITQLEQTGERGQKIAVE
jgi:transcription elongation GreA/GreB family factor